MLRLRTILIIIAAVVVFAAVGVLGYWALRGKSVPAASEVPSPGATTAVKAEPLSTDVSFGKSMQAEVKAAEEAAPPAAQLEGAYLAIARLAASYGEVYGSYTTKDPYRNLKDLYDAMTPAMQKWADGIMAGGPPSGAAVTVVTRALSTQMVSKDTGRAVFTVQTQRTVIKETTETQYLTLEVSLEKIGEEWKLGGAAWKSE